MNWEPNIVEEWRHQERRRHFALRAWGVVAFLLASFWLVVFRLAYCLAFGG